MKNRKILSLCILIILLIGCEREERTPRIVIGKGDVVTRTIDVNAFQRVALIGFENLILTSGEPQTLKIHAQSNVIDAISTELKDGLLTIDYLPKVNVTTTEPVTIEIINPGLTSALLRGIGNFELEGEYDKEIDLEFAGTGNMDAYNLYLSICNFILSGTGNCYVRADSILNVTLSGYGNVLYKGNAEVTSTITGVGQVIDDN